MRRAAAAASACSRRCGGTAWPTESSAADWLASIGIGFLANNAARAAAAIRSPTVPINSKSR
jgi:hypothetical protein